MSATDHTREALAELRTAFKRVAEDHPFICDSHDDLDCDCGIDDLEAQIDSIAALVEGRDAEIARLRVSNDVLRRQRDGMDDAVKVAREHLAEARAALAVERERIAMDLEVLAQKCRAVPSMTDYTEGSHDAYLNAARIARSSTDGGDTND